MLLFTYIGCLVCDRDYLVAFSNNIKDKGFRLCKARLHNLVSTPACGTEFRLHIPVQPDLVVSKPPSYLTVCLGLYPCT
jgi:hypothetical protein